MKSMISSELAIFQMLMQIDDARKLVFPKKMKKSQKKNYDLLEFTNPQKCQESTDLNTDSRAD